MSPEFIEDREKLEARIKKELEAFINKYEQIKGLKVDVSFNVQQTKSGNFVTPNVGLRIEI